MPNYSKAIVVGHITRKPELKYLQSGTPVAEVGIAVNKTWNDAGGQKQEKASFFDITMFGKQAEAFSNYCDKGSAVLIEGELVQDTWQDNNGNNRSKVKIQASKWAFMGGKQQSQQQQQAPMGQAPTPPVPPVPQPSYDESMPSDEEIPF